MVWVLLRVGLAASSLIWVAASPLATAQSARSTKGNPTKFVFLLPDGFRGWVCVDFGIAGAAPLARDGDARVIRPGPGGVLATSDRVDSPVLYGAAWYEVNGRRKALPEDVTLQPGPSRSGASEPTQRSCAFVGTADERDAATDPPGFEEAPGLPKAIPDSDRRALIALYNATNGGSWTHHVGWLGAPGTECHWHGVECVPIDGKMRVVDLDLEANNLSGTIPSEIGQLSKLTMLDLGKNRLAGTIPSALGNLSELEWFSIFGNNLSGLVPSPLLRRWLGGPLDISAEGHLLTDVTEIDFESSASSLCARDRYILRADGSVVSYAVHCRNSTPRDRATYCEVREGEVDAREFAKLGSLIERDGFFELAAHYSRGMTHAILENTRVTRSGKSHAVSNYAEAGPFQLWTIQRAIEGVAKSTEWDKTSTQQGCPRW